MKYIFLVLLWSPVLSVNNDFEKVQKAKIETLKLVHAVCFFLFSYIELLYFSDLASWRQNPKYSHSWRPKEHYRHLDFRPWRTHKNRCRTRVPLRAIHQEKI